MNYEDWATNKIQSLVPLRRWQTCEDIASMIVFAVLLARPPSFLAELKREQGHLATALGALVVGTIIAFIFNDSGVVAAATSITFGIGALLYLLLLAQRPGDGAQWEGLGNRGG